jgi:hypothetical protein
MSATAPAALVVTDEVGTLGEHPNLLVHGDCLDAMAASTAIRPMTAP